MKVPAGIGCKKPYHKGKMVKNKTIVYKTIKMIFYMCSILVTVLSRSIFSWKHFLGIKLLNDLPYTARVHQYARYDNVNPIRCSPVEGCDLVP